MRVSEANASGRKHLFGVHVNEEAFELKVANYLFGAHVNEEALELEVANYMVEKLMLLKTTCTN